MVARAAGPLHYGQRGSGIIADPLEQKCAASRLKPISSSTLAEVSSALAICARSTPNARNARDCPA